MLFRILRGCMFAAIACANFAASATAAPAGGVFAIINATSPQAEKRQEALVSPAFQTPGVNGLLIHLHWNQIIPARGQFDWTALDRAALLATAANKRFEIGIVTNGAMPDWVTAPPPDGAGALHGRFRYNAAMANGCNSLVMASPYDAAYLAAFRDTLRALSAHLRSTGAYASLSMLKLVGITTSESGPDLDAGLDGQGRQRAADPSALERDQRGR